MLLLIVAWALAAVVLVITLLAGRGIVRRNKFAGIRLRSTFASDSAWRRGHTAAVPSAAVAAAITTVVGVIGLIVSGVDDGARETFGFVMMGVDVAGVLVGTAVANRAARQA